MSAHCPYTYYLTHLTSLTDLTSLTAKDSSCPSGPSGSSHASGAARLATAPAVRVWALSQMVAAAPLPPWIRLTGAFGRLGVGS
jgi:hypothetical protein